MVQQRLGREEVSRPKGGFRMMGNTGKSVCQVCDEECYGGVHECRKKNEAQVQAVWGWIGSSVHVADVRAVAAEFFPNDNVKRVSSADYYLEDRAVVAYLKAVSVGSVVIGKMTHQEVLVEFYSKYGGQFRRSYVAWLVREFRKVVGFRGKEELNVSFQDYLLVSRLTAGFVADVPRAGAQVSGAGGDGDEEELVFEISQVLTKAEKLVTKASEELWCPVQVETSVEAYKMELGDATLIQGFKDERMIEAIGYFSFHNLKAQVVPYGLLVRGNHSGPVTLLRSWFAGEVVAWVYKERPCVVKVYGAEVVVQDPWGYLRRILQSQGMDCIPVPGAKVWQLMSRDPRARSKVCVDHGWVVASHTAVGCLFSPIEVGSPGTGYVEGNLVKGYPCVEVSTDTEQFGFDSKLRDMLVRSLSRLSPGLFRMVRKYGLLMYVEGALVAELEKVGLRGYCYSLAVKSGEDGKVRDLGFMPKLRDFLSLEVSDYVGLSMMDKLYVSMKPDVMHLSCFKRDGDISLVDLCRVAYAQGMDTALTRFCVSERGAINFPLEDLKLGNVRIGAEGSIGKIFEAERFLNRREKAELNGMEFQERESAFRKWQGKSPGSVVRKLCVGCKLVVDLGHTCSVRVVQSVDGDVDGDDWLGDALFTLDVRCAMRLKGEDNAKYNGYASNKAMKAYLLEKGHVLGVGASDHSYGTMFEKLYKGEFRKKYLQDKFGGRAGAVMAKVQELVG